MRHAIAVIGFILSCGVYAATPPQLLTNIAIQGSFVQGTERLYPVRLREDSAIDRVSGGAVASILWSIAANDLYPWQNKGDGTFTSSQLASYPGSGGYYGNYPSGLNVVSILPANP